MKAHTAILAVAVLAIISAPILLFSDGADGELSEDTYRIWGVSKTEGGTLALAIDETTKIAFPLITWSVYLAEDTHVKMTHGEDIIIDASLTAGIHDYDVEIAPGAYVTVWEIGEEKTTMALTVVSGATSAMEYEYPNDILTITKAQYKKEEQEIAIGCIILALMPSIFIIPYWQRRKDEDFYDVI